jgi:hypothetical protein
MARTTATNFSGGLQFPYATAGTDAFKKEDVQTLAQAVDQHDHSTGKGLILPVAAIPPITSAMITDGTIATVDLANSSVTTAKLATNAATLAGSANVITSGPTTSSTTLVDMPDMAVTMVTVGGDLLIWLMATLRPDTLNAVATVALDIDGSATGPTAQASAGVASQVLCLSVAHRIAAPSAASHTIKARWSISSGSVLAFFTYRSLVVEEIRR